MHDAVTGIMPGRNDDRLDLVAARFGTPAYVYDLAALRQAHRDLIGALPDGTAVHYSLKANPHQRLVAELAALGCRAEVSSVGEIDAALAAGMRPETTQLTGPGKTDATIAYAFDRGVRRFSVDSPHDIARVAAFAARDGSHATCLLRVNADQPVPGMGLAMTGVASQFGADASWITSRPEMFRGSGTARVSGLHCYAGTNLRDEDTLLRQFETSIRHAARIRALLPEVTEVNLGGGFGTPYARAGQRPRFPTLATRLTRLLDDHLPQWRTGAPDVTFESGRYLVGDAGTLLCRIVDVKVSKGRTFVILDAGVNHLGGMSGLGRLLPLAPSVLGRQTGDTAPVPCSVVGPLCTTLDTFGHGIPLYDPRPGRLVTIPNVGAYGLTASLLAFLGHPAPIEVTVDGADIVDASRLCVRRSTS